MNQSTDIRTLLAHQLAAKNQPITEQAIDSLLLEATADIIVQHPDAMTALMNRITHSQQKKIQSLETKLRQSETKQQRFSQRAAQISAMLDSMPKVQQPKAQAKSADRKETPKTEQGFEQIIAQLLNAGQPQKEQLHDFQVLSMDELLAGFPDFKIFGMPEKGVGKTHIDPKEAIKMFQNVQNQGIEKEAIKAALEAQGISVVFL